MTDHPRAQARPGLPLLVAVIASRDDIHKAERLRHAPDVFELRLDAFADENQRLLDFARKVRVPLIVTARHPREGGLHNLRTTRRLQLLHLFLPLAAYVDIELRWLAELGSVLPASKARRVGVIVSVHELEKTPEVSELHRLAAAAAAFHADVFKVATRTETAADVARLVKFYDEADGPMPISAMGIGRLGRHARRLLALRGSALNYAHLGTRAVEGQFSLGELRRIVPSRR